MKRAALWATVLLLSACGSGAPNAAVSSPSPTVAPFCSASNPCLALVTLRGTNEVVVRDITDINNPKTVSHLGVLPSPQFVSASQLSYVNGQNLVRAPLLGSPKTNVASFSTSWWLLLSTWSPNGSTAAYVLNSDAKSELHSVTGADNRVLSSMPPFNGGCESRACSDGSDFHLSFSPDGKYISMMQSWGGPNFRLWTRDGKLVTGNTEGVSYNMSAWSGDGLYFLDGTGVVVWRDGRVSPFLPGINWTRPKASPSGGQFVYMARDAKSLGHVFVADIATRKVREIKSGRSEPMFLTPRYLWYKGERSCSTGTNCDPTFPVVDTGTTYIYDLQTGTESTSIITGVFDVWPHAA